jgi:hypothetical protein
MCARAMNRRVAPILLAASLCLLGMHCANGSSDVPPSPDDSNNPAADNVPGNLVITSPKRAAFLPNDKPTVEVTGTGASSALTINGQPVQVASDGSFTTTITPMVGLNVIMAVDGDSKLATPFLYGAYHQPTDSIPQAAVLHLAPSGFQGNGPTLASIAEEYLARHDLLASVRGHKFTGSIPGGSWTYTLSGGHYDHPSVSITPGSSFAVGASFSNLVVDGEMELDFLFISYSHSVQMTANKVLVAGSVDVSFDSGRGGVAASMSHSDVTVDNYQFNSDDGGLPCCVDSIVTDYLRPKVQSAIQDAVHQHLPASLEMTLSGFGIPTSIDLSGLGIPKPVPILSRFDRAQFDANGGTLSASLLIGGPLDPSSPGATAPGWLSLGGPFNVRSATSSPLTVSLSLDALNQLFFTVWGTGALARNVPDTADVTGISIAPAMPPVAVPADGGAIRLAIGELVVNASLNGNPFTAAASVVVDIVPSLDAQGFLLTPRGKPTTTITWLDAKGIIPGVRDIIAAAAEGQIDNLLHPMRVPLPAIALDKLGSEFARQSLTLVSPSFTVDGKAGRVGISGNINVSTK